MVLSTNILFWEKKRDVCYALLTNQNLERDHGQNTAEKSTGQNLCEVPTMWGGANLPGLECITEREESQESWQKTFTSTFCHLQVVSWSWERSSKILIFVLVQEHWKLILPFTWKKPGAVADFLSWQNVPHDSRGPVANGGGSGCLGRVLHTVLCSIEGSWRPSSLFLLRCPYSGRTRGPKGWVLEDDKCWDLTAKHNGKLHGQQQWEPIWHHENQISMLRVTSQGFPVKWAGCRESQQKPKKTQRIKEHWQFHLLKKEEEKGSFPIQVKRFFLFVCFDISRNEAYKENHVNDRK